MFSNIIIVAFVAVAGVPCFGQEISPWSFTIDLGDRTAFLYKERVTWHKALESCIARGQELIYPLSRDDILTIVDQMFLHDSGWSGYIWVGASSLSNNSSYRFLNGVEIPLDSPLWYPGEPNYTEECVVFFGQIDKGLADYYCDVELSYHACV